MSDVAAGGPSLWVFVATIVALACTPGADALYVITRQARRRPALSG